MFKVRNLFIVSLVFLVAFGVAGCGNKTDKSGTNNSDQTNVQQQQPVNAAFLDAQSKLERALAPLPQKGSQAKLAALEITLANPFWVTMKEGYEAAAKEYGCTIDVMAAPKESDVNSQLETLKTIVNKDYDAIALSAITPFNLVPGVAEATKKGIPVIAVGTSVDSAEAKKAGAKIEAFVTSNFEDQGKMGAEYIMEQIGGSGKVAVIEGLPGADQSEARKRGAQKAFESNKDITLLPIQTGNFDRQTAYNVAANLIQANPDLKGIFCANDVMALGVVEALKAAAGKKDQVVVVGVDFIDEARESISKGELNATVAMSPYLFGRGGLILALKVLEGQEVNQDIYWTPMGLVTKDNVSTFEGWK